MVMTASTVDQDVNPYTVGRLPKYTAWVTLATSLIVAFLIATLVQAGAPLAELNIVIPIIAGIALHTVVLYALSRLVEGERIAKDRLVTTLVTLAFVVAMLPLLSLVFTVITLGSARLDIDFFTLSMRNVLGEGGGAAHAIIGKIGRAHV